MDGIQWFGPKGGGSLAATQNRRKCFVAGHSGGIRFLLGLDAINGSLGWKAGDRVVVGLDDSNIYLKKTDFKGFKLAENKTIPGVLVAGGPTQMGALFPFLKGAGRVHLSWFVKDGVLAMHRPTREYVETCLGE